MSTKDIVESADSKLRALAERIKGEHPKANEEEFLELWKAEINASKDLQEALRDWTFNDQWERLNREGPDQIWGRRDTER